jgi:hypothetical protein
VCRLNIPERLFVVFAIHGLATLQTPLQERLALAQTSLEHVGKTEIGFPGQRDVDAQLFPYLSLADKKVDGFVVFAILDPADGKFAVAQREALVDHAEFLRDPDLNFEGLFLVDATCGVAVGVGGDRTEAEVDVAEDGVPVGVGDLFANLQRKLEEAVEFLSLTALALVPVGNQ